MSPPAEDRTAAKFEAARRWLRYHADYQLKVEMPWSYATIRVVFSHAGAVIVDDMGETITKRLDKVLGAMAAIDALDWWQARYYTP